MGTPKSSKREGDSPTLTGERLLLPPIEEITVGDELNARRVIKDYLGPSVASAVDLKEISRVDCFEPSLFHEAVRGTLAAYNKLSC